MQQSHLQKHVELSARIGAKQFISIQYLFSLFLRDDALTTIRAIGVSGLIFHEGTHKQIFLLTFLRELDLKVARQSHNTFRLSEAITSLVRHP